MRCKFIRFVLFNHIILQRIVKKGEQKMYTTRIANGMTIISLEKPIKSNHVGVYNKGEKYSVRITVSRKSYYLGMYDTIGEAIAVHADAVKHRSNGTFLDYYYNMCNKKKQR